MLRRHTIGIFAGIFLCQLLRFSPGLLQNDGDGYVSSFPTRNHSEISLGDRQKDLFSGTTRVTATKIQHSDQFAPLIIGAGQGTTGTHLFVDATCALGFVSLHYGIGCLPKQILNISTEIRDTRMATRKTGTPLQLLSPYKHYRTLLERHQHITRGFLKVFKNNETDPLQFREQILRDLEDIITWGKYNKVGLALHDTPYPMLMPEILKIVQKHYGHQTKPIILLSERDPEEYVARRIKSHGSYSWICRPQSSTKTAIEKMKPITLEGGAFDLIGCINRAVSSSRKPVRIQDIFYTMQKASKLEQREFLIDSFRNYQDTVRESAIFWYNMFNKENKTRTTELASMIGKSMVESLTGSDTKLLLKGGANFIGFERFFTVADRGIPYHDSEVSALSNSLINILVFKNQVVLS